MRRAKYVLAIICIILLIFFYCLSHIAYSGVRKPEVPRIYQNFFVHYIDNRSVTERALNIVGLSQKHVGRSFALIAGISKYPAMSFADKELEAADEDLKKLHYYLKNSEIFDEIVILENGDVTFSNLEYFLKVYFPKRLRAFPKSRFLFAYSGHGMNEGFNGYLLKTTARNLKDKDNTISLQVLRVLVDEIVKSGHHILILINACYSGSFLERIAFGKPKPTIQMEPGAHAITAGGTGERTFSIPNIGSGSVFFEKLLAALDGKADYTNDGVVTVYELYTYLKEEIQIFTDRDQNPRIGDISKHGSKGEFFFLNRNRQVSKKVWETLNSDKGRSFGRNFKDPNGIDYDTNKPIGYVKQVHSQYNFIVVELTSPVSVGDEIFVGREKSNLVRVKILKTNFDFASAKPLEKFYKISIGDPVFASE